MRGQTSHLDPGVLARFRAGLIAGRRGAALAAHLAGCDRCAALDGTLTEVSALLAAVPPPTIPDDVAHRLDMVLAAEVAERKDHPERGRGDGARARATGRRQAGRHRFRLVAIRVLAPAAAAVLAAGGYGLSQLGGHASSAASAPVPSAARAAGSTQEASNPHNLPEEPAARAPFGVVVSDTNYLRATLSQQLQAELRESPSASQSPSAQMKACVLHVTGGAVPALVQSARYQGQPAIVIVVSRTSGDMAWVVGPGCSATSDDLLAKATLPPGISAP